MFISSIQLKNFRNYEDLNFEFLNSVTILFGNNAQGKTNFLEAIYFLATSKSIKADRDDELICNGEEFLRIEGQIENTDKINLEVAMQKNPVGTTKRIKVNGIPRRLSDYSQNLAVVFFRPEDIELITGSPSIRRYFIDQLLSQIDRNYRKTLSDYENIVTRKNKILKNIREGFSKRSELTYWLDQQILLGNILTKKRQEFFEFINSQTKKFGDFRYEYLPSEVTRERLEEYSQKEIDSASSLVGPHRDDFVFFLVDKNLSKYGSRGEQRTAVLDLKLLEVEFIEKKLGSRPILLLDDIFSELDTEHRRHVIDLSKLQQTVIATIELETDFKTLLNEALLINVAEGKFIQK